MELFGNSTAASEITINHADVFYCSSEVGWRGQLGPRFHRLLLRIWGDVEALQASERWRLSGVSTAGPPTGRRRPDRTPHPGADGLSRLLSPWRSSGPRMNELLADRGGGACPFAPPVSAISFCSQKHQAISTAKRHLVADGCRTLGHKT